MVIGQQDCHLEVLWDTRETDVESFICVSDPQTQNGGRGLCQLLLLPELLGLSCGSHCAVTMGFTGIEGVGGPTGRCDV